MQRFLNQVCVKTSKSKTSKSDQVADKACIRGAHHAKTSKSSQSQKWILRDRPNIASLEDLQGLIGHISAIACAADGYEAPSPAIQWAQDVIFMTEANFFVDDSLVSIVNRCNAAVQKSVRVEFLFMINCIQLVLKCQR